MTRNETPDTAAADTSVSSAESPRKGRSGPVAELGLVAAGLGLVIYLIGFVANVGGGSSSLVAPLLLGGGLLAGSVALPTVSSRVLAPAAVLTTTGALLLLRTVVDDGGSALVVGALVLALLEAAAAVGATLTQAGVVRPRPPKARKAAEPATSTAFAGHPGGPQFPGQQYPGQPFPGTYSPAPHPVQPYPGDQWTGEHAYAQNARYGGQYGVPGYPPPPPSGTPGYEATLHHSEAPTVAVGTEAVGDATSPPRGTRPVTEPAGGAPEPGSGYRSPVDPGTGGFPSSGTGSHRAVPDSVFRPSDPGAASGGGSHRTTGTGSYPAIPDAPVSGTGSYRTASGTGSYPAAGETATVTGTGSHRPGGAGRRDPEAVAPPESESEHTRAIPTVSDDKS